jgi:DNA-directed RNA polymerase specialized sigma24 family protein
MVLRYYSGLNSAQVAEVLDLNASTVRSRLKKARMIMARQLTNEGIE